GWGATDDRQACIRRTRRRSVDELFAAGYLRYARYLDPVTRQPGTIFDVMAWLVRQKETAARLRGGGRPQRVVCVGVPRWKAFNLAPMLAPLAGRLLFAASVAAARKLEPRSGDQLVFWGGTAPEGL